MEDLNNFRKLLANYLKKSTHKRGLKQTDKCLNDKDLLNYLNNDLEENRRLKIEAHIKTCDRCIGELITFFKVYSSREEYDPDDTLINKVKTFIKDIVFQDITYLKAYFIITAEKSLVKETDGEINLPLKSTFESEVTVFWELDKRKIEIKLSRSKGVKSNLRVGLTENGKLVEKVAVNLKSEDKKLVKGPFKTSSSNYLIIHGIKPGTYTLELFLDKYYIIKLQMSQ